jgi:predicted porin
MAALSKLRMLVTLGICAVGAHGWSAAYAQSSVTLYGNIDTGISYINNAQVSTPTGVAGRSSWSMTTGNSLLPSYFGLKGAEDLGGGNSAIFNLQNYFVSNNGAMFEPNGLFDGTAMVGLKSDALGSLTFGRQFDSYLLALYPFAASNIFAGPGGAHFGDTDNLNLSLNFHNAIQYASPTFAGFSFGGTFALGNQAGSFNTNRGWAVAASYANGPFAAGAGYMSLRNPFTATLGGASAYTGQFSCGQSPASYCKLQDAQELRNFGLGASYAFGDLSLATTLTRSKLVQSQYLAASGGPVTDVTFSTGELSAIYNVTPALQVAGAYSFTYGKLSATGASPKIHKANLGVLYSLSKRTLLYVIGSYERMAGDGIGINPVTGGMEQYAQLSYFPTANSPTQVGATVGIKHSF